MTQDTKYNGWTNYATWRVNLEMFDGQPVDVIDDSSDPWVIGQYCKEMAEEFIGEGATGCAFDYAMAFIADVNWYEIAEHMIEDYRVKEEEES